MTYCACDKDAARSLACSSLHPEAKYRIKMLHEPSTAIVSNELVFNVAMSSLYCSPPRLNACEPRCNVTRMLSGLAWYKGG
jgi:hypothetical protein